MVAQPRCDDVPERILVVVDRLRNVQGAPRQATDQAGAVLAGQQIGSAVAGGGGFPLRRAGQAAGAIGIVGGAGDQGFTCQCHCRLLGARAFQTCLVGRALGVGHVSRKSEQAEQ
ncbi:MAG: heme-binding protein [Dechloromonas sp.]|nr:heme-binding protein [Dechloromonas sp.]